MLSSNIKRDKEIGKCLENYCKNIAKSGAAAFYDYTDRDVLYSKNFPRKFIA